MAIAFVNATFSTGSTTAGNTKTITYSSTAGNTIVVFGFAPGTATVTNVTDTANNVYYPRAVGTTASVWSTEAGAAKTTASITITVTFSGSIRNTCCAVGYSGVTGVGKSLTQVTGSSNAPSASFTTQNNNNVFVAGMGATGTGTWSLTTGTALRGSQAGAGATTPGGGIIDNTSATPASVTCTAGLSASESWGVTGVELTTVQASGDLDDFWTNPVAPVIDSLITPAQATFDEQLPSGNLHGLMEESYWKNPVTPVPATNQVPNAWQFEQNEVVVPTYSRAITIDHTKVGGSDLTDYVALVKGTYSYLATVANGGLVQNASGFDVLFYSDSALTSKLNWEVESYDPTTGTVVYWVRLPSVSHTVDTTFYIAYGSSSITTDQSNTVQAWAGAGAPEPVYHLNNASFTDSNNGTKNAVGQNSPTSGTGQIGTGAVFNGSNQNAYVSPAQLPGGTLFPASAGSPGSVSLWISLSSYGTQIFLYQDGVGHDNFRLTIPTSSSGTFGLGLGSNPTVPRPTLKNNFLLSTLYKLDFTWNASNLIALYVNGVLDNSFVASDSTSGSVGWSTTIGSFAFGGTPTTGQFFTGLLDELRVYQQANSADFITCSYNNESSPSTFYSIGSQRPGQVLEDDSWWSSVMQSGATVALATALSVAAMTGVAIQPNGWQDELPQTPSITLVDEDSAPYLPPPIPATLQYPQQWSFDTPEDVTHVDEDYWQNQTAPVASSLTWPQQYQFDEQIPSGLYGVPDDSDWSVTPPPVVATILPQPWLFADEVVASSPHQVDEDYWSNPVAPAPAANVSLALFDDAIPELYVPEEDYWLNPVSPVTSVLAYPAQATFDEQIPAGLSGQPDEDYWQNRVPAVPLSMQFPAAWAFEQNDPPSLVHFDEDYWTNAVPPVQATSIAPQQWAFDSNDIDFTQSDEDFWTNPVPPISSILTGLPQWGFDQQELPAFGLEEDLWTNPVSPLQLSFRFPQPSIFEQNESPTLSGEPDEDFWRNPVAPVQATLLVPQPFLFEQNETASLLGQPDEDYWANPVPPTAASLLQVLPLGDREEIPAGSLYGVPEFSDVWVNPVASSPLSFLQLPLWSFDQNDIDFVQYDEDFWTNPVAPAISTLASLPQWTFDPQDVPSVLFRLDEDGWIPKPPLQPSFLFPQQATFEQNESPTLSGRTEEDYWSNSVAPEQANLRLLQPFQFEQNEAPSLGKPDEDYWKNPVVPVQSANVWPQPSVFEQDDPTTLHGVPEVDAWVNPAPLQPTKNIVFSVVDEDFVTPFVLDDGYWSNPVPPANQSNSVTAFSDDEVIPPSVVAEAEPWVLGSVNRDWRNLVIPIWVDVDAIQIAPAAEDYWQNNVAPLAATLRQILIPDVESIPTLLSSNEDYWSNPVAPKRITYTVPNPWTFDGNQQSASTSNFPVIVEMFSVVDIVSSDGDFIDIVKAVNFTIQNLPMVVDITCVDNVEVNNFTVVDVTEVIMPIPTVIAYTQLNEKYLTLGPVLGSLPPNAPIVGATVTASLYANRSFGIPGTVVPQLHNLPLADQGAGVYQGLMSDPAFDPAPGQNYTTVIDLLGGGGQGHWEIPSIVLPRVS